MNALVEQLSRLVLTCERLGIQQVDLVPDNAWDERTLEWLDQAEIRMHGFPKTSRPGAIDVMPGGGGGAVFEDLNEFACWLSSRLHEDDLLAKVDKLRSTQRADLHLFLRVHDTAMPFSLYYPLAWGDAVPSSPLTPPAGLTGVWLAPAWRNPLLWWGSKAGWNRTNCLD